MLTNIQNGTLTGEDAKDCLDLINNNDPDVNLVLHDVCQVEATCPCGEPTFGGQTTGTTTFVDTQQRLCFSGAVDPTSAMVGVSFANDGTLTCVRQHEGFWTSFPVLVFPNTTRDEANACVIALRAPGVGACSNLPLYP